MSSAGSAREALIAEALGELGVLLDRIETIRPVVEAACQELAEQMAAAEERVVQATEHVAAAATQRVERQVDDLAARTAAAHTRTMAVAARTIFRAELGTALQHLALAIDQRAKQANRQPSRWWHALTAVVTAAVAWVVAAYLAGGCSA